MFFQVKLKLEIMRKKSKFMRSFEMNDKNLNSETKFLDEK